MQNANGAIDDRVEHWKGLAELGVDHYSGLFEMIEQAPSRQGAIKVFLLLGQKGVHLVKYNLKSRSLEQQRIADGLPADAPELRAAAELQAANDARWAEAFGACGGLGIDIVILLVGVATSGAGGAAVIVWKLAEIGPSAIKCTMAYQAWSAGLEQRPAWKDSSLGKVLYVGADVADIGLTVRKAYQSVDRLRRVARWSEQFQRPAGRHLAEAVQWQEGARLALVHLPNLALKGSNLLATPRTLDARQVSLEIAQAAVENATVVPQLPFFWPADEVRRWSGLSGEEWELPFFVPRF